MPEEKERLEGVAEIAAAESAQEKSELAADEEAAGVEEAATSTTKKIEKQKKEKKPRPFNPHNTARVEALAGLPLATFRQRLIAYAIDFLLVATITALIVACINYELTNVWEVHHKLVDKAQGYFKSLPSREINEMDDVVEFASILAYFGLWVWLTNGKTFGKRLMRIRIISLTREHITLWQSIERALGYGASALEAGFGFFQFFVYQNRTCVHDRIAETIVVQEPPRKKKEKVLN